MQYEHLATLLNLDWLNHQNEAMFPQQKNIPKRIHTSIEPLCMFPFSLLLDTCFIPWLQFFDKRQVYSSTLFVTAVIAQSV
jgi:uncharacterized protein YceK